MNQNKTTSTLVIEESAFDDELSITSASVEAKRKQVIRDIGRTVVAALTALGLLKGMSFAGQNHDVFWIIALGLGSGFWAAGMWLWKEIDG